ncbi:MAG: hypothetical protein A2268_14375 [Candidatus Raymondbacteria bacterium RifOxyA12_full_50_37]|uniref:Secretion system C-terminal sorting domain-containing protein n=1 Tax=Candidatus Raymondbacteria bacterium RIFOXYD12_FULL_49_13 TaxID=1817890 RepID=A0A1F7FKX4_UNCRA|nr:MAG: hypothetical protein A2268_14375 [Candidatus Raymondbacteria bacterium RifOxyA12_full_50_37]OGJ86944.1 MAG: hypothetical protein A2350_02290 [Candidatus Raymondbacteria bacterium RifOxyB12_full_50_8]OGJ88266.1 MAG: hypothetical protein A2248_19715 [Candidatus Raymondbacteria bacterium RIFOXYA2_FULL_49_16]OGK07310.1 MAG: hypothetical protein A2519_14390 [Candidatus Raymondbacteria bacterium RIFOXYD12_FULL_49_13]OGK08039.1 MAG: hypothetical protein A2487_10415 [Candidatus Raymondbacteria 
MKNRVFNTIILLLGIDVFCCTCPLPLVSVDTLSQDTVVATYCDYFEANCRVDTNILTEMMNVLISRYGYSENVIIGHYDSVIRTVHPTLRLGDSVRVIIDTALKISAIEDTFWAFNRIADDCIEGLHNLKHRQFIAFFNNQYIMGDGIGFKEYFCDLISDSVKLLDGFYLKNNMIVNDRYVGIGIPLESFLSEISVISSENKVRDVCSAERNFLLFPNPCNSMPVIVSKERVSFVLDIFDVKGKKVFSNYYFNRKKLDLRTILPRGIYMIRISYSSNQNILREVFQYIRY